MKSSMNPHLRIVILTPVFVVASLLMMFVSWALGKEGREIVGWGWVPTDDLRDAWELAAQERAFALAAEARYTALERYVMEGHSYEE